MPMKRIFGNPTQEYCMSRYTHGLTIGSALLLAVVLLSNGPVALGDEDDDKAIAEAQKDVVELAGAIGSGKDGKDVATRMKKKYEELNTIMQVYKPSTKKGLGTGIPPKGPGDGIEAKIISLGKRVPADIEKQKAALIKLAYINLAMAEVTKLYPPSKPKNGKGVKEWQQHVADMKKSSEELLKAVKSGDSAKIKDAANNVNSSCNNCHSDFRDEPS
jgi:Cytochrome C'